LGGFQQDFSHPLPAIQDCVNIRILMQDHVHADGNSHIIFGQLNEILPIHNDLLSCWVNHSPSHNSSFNDYRLLHETGELLHYLAILWDKRVRRMGLASNQVVMGV
jgi:hypothetical protein